VVSWVLIVVGVLLLVDAVRRVRGRTGGGGEAPLPVWMGALDRLKPAGVLGGGVVLGGVRPKSFLLAVGGAAAIAQTGIAGGQQAVCGAAGSPQGLDAPQQRRDSGSGAAGDRRDADWRWNRRTPIVIVEHPSSRLDEAEQDEASDTTTTA
jgi:hypothetical protein